MTMMMLMRPAAEGDGYDAYSDYAMVLKLTLMTTMMVMVIMMMEMVMMMMLSRELLQNQRLAAFKEESSS